MNECQGTNNLDYSHPTQPLQVGVGNKMDSLDNVTLRPWPATRKEELSQEDLLFKIEQLAGERGHLRNITEQSLQEDFDAGKDVPDATTDGVKEEDKEKDIPSGQDQREKVFKAAREMYEHLEYA
jgi:mediator of RNA polymerase II transcription subunit 17